MLRQTIAALCCKKGLTKGGLLLPNLLFFKMAKDKISMPSSGAGITRYFDEYQSALKFKPGHIIVLCIIVIIITLLLHIYGSSMLGLG
jgi:preprotein translocase subunit Sec61beta